MNLLWNLQHLETAHLSFKAKLNLSSKADTSKTVWNQILKAFARKCTNLVILKQNATNKNPKTLAVKIFSANYWNCPQRYIRKHVYL